MTIKLLITSAICIAFGLLLIHTAVKFYSKPKEPHYYFFSYAHEKGFGNGTMVYNNFFSISATKAHIEKEQNLDNVIITNFQEITKDEFNSFY